MQTHGKMVVLSMVVVVISVWCVAQSNVYSLAVYSAGNYFADMCSFDFPFPPYRFKLTQRSWFEDANGLTIIDARREKTHGGIMRRCVEVECESDRFCIRLDSFQPKRGSSNMPEMGSGDLSRLVTQCVAARGGHSTTNTLPAIQVAWVRVSRGLRTLSL